ncbi:uncharacterized protein LOC119348691 isoform X2 [Triticum dicoccoides]|uniref:uncharacterized protein LOC119348691 isoform X2 n=1 Tax=Triticum dicoccoides TaxID=85692 RepID=UPI00188FA2A5|nr:uncharacterized protein LOC119348691 isoform X2 [Triticum dicoccoides]
MRGPPSARVPSPSPPMPGATATNRHRREERRPPRRPSTSLLPSSSPRQIVSPARTPPSTTTPASGTASSRLYIKQASFGITFADEDDPEPEWAAQDQRNQHVHRSAQIGFFPEQRAFVLRYQTVRMLETVLRASELGEDDTGEESSKD